MAKIAYEDFSGTSTPVTANPYDGIIEACKNDPVCIAQDEVISPWKLKEG